MTIYLVFCQDIDEANFCSAFSTKEKADAYITKRNLTKDAYQDFFIEEHIIDAGN